jgi:hypothetical protein
VYLGSNPTDNIRVLPETLLLEMLRLATRPRAKARAKLRAMPVL